MKKTYLHWDILEEAREWFERMHLNIDVVVGISKGGLPAAVLASHVLKKPLYLVEAKSYTETHHKKKMVFKPLNLPKKLKNKNIFLVDDIFDTGETLKTTMKYLEQDLGATVFPFVLVSKEMPNIVHGVIVMKLCKKEEWIVFPWEHEPPA